MAKNEKLRDPVPEQFESLEEAAAFWDSHDLTEYEDIWKPVELQVRFKATDYVIKLEQQLAERVTETAKSQHMTTESLVHRALEEYLNKHAA